jgi:hypothetical protein
MKIKVRRKRPQNSKRL